MLECLGHRVWQWRWRIDRYAKGAYINNSTGLLEPGVVKIHVNVNIIYLIILAKPLLWRRRDMAHA